MRGKNEAILGLYCCFLTVLLIGYLEPVFFPAEKPTETAQSGRLSSAHTAVPHEELPASGYAAYIGKMWKPLSASLAILKKKLKQVVRMNYGRSV